MVNGLRAVTYNYNSYFNTSIKIEAFVGHYFEIETTNTFYLSL